MAKTRILIIDSNVRSIQFLREQLLRGDYEISALSEVKDLRFLKEVNRPHLVLFDLAFPGLGGLDFVAALRKESPVPLLVLLNTADTAQRIEALEAGADDVLATPYEPRELMARVQSILRRVPVRELPQSVELETREWRFKGLTVQSNRRRVVLDGEAVELTTAEFDLLRLLVTNSQQVLSREVILDQLRGVEWAAIDRSIDILVSRLRDKLKDDPRRPRFIRTVRSVGYQFVGEAMASELAPNAPATQPTSARA